MDWPPFDAFLGPGNFIAAHGDESIGGMTMNTGSVAWSSANRAIYIPFRINDRRKATKLGVLNGATVSGNIDVGIYDAAGTKLVSSGSTAQAGTSAIQSFDITDTIIGPGLFFFGVAQDNTTGTLFSIRPDSSGGTGAAHLQAMGCLMQATAFALPATATFARITATSVPIIVAVTRGSVL